MQKNYLLILFISCITFQIVLSQEITGIATYKSFMKFDVKLDSTQVPKEIQAQLLETIKQQTQKEYELKFNKDEAIYKEKDKLEKPSNTMFSGAIVTTSGGFGVSYKNLKEDRYTIQRELYDKLFLITDSLEKQDWKLEKETKNIGEYTCFKATRTRITENPETGEKKEIPIEAWYTPQIPISFGPLGYGGLPGLILEINSGDLSYLCNKIILNPKNGVTIEAPTKGEKVSKEEFDKIQIEKVKEMEERNDFHGNKSIRIKVGG